MTKRSRVALAIVFLLAIGTVTFTQLRTPSQPATDPDVFAKAQAAADEASKSPPPQDPHPQPGWGVDAPEGN